MVKIFDNNLAVLETIAIFEAPCDTDGWMTIQRRKDFSVNFNRSWVDYTNGFGNLTGDFFLGLEKLHQLTKDKPHEMSIKLVDSRDNTYFAYYDDFQIGSEQEFYSLKSLGTFIGSSGMHNHLRYLEGMKFSTFDSDNDEHTTYNCASMMSGGWWYRDCGYCQLNDSVWGTIDGIPFVEMTIKPKSE
nr:angiopoietin-4-like [Drosophila takahashii]